MNRCVILLWTVIAFVQAQAQPPAAIAEKPYLLQPFDEVEIRVYNMPELSQVTRIRPDGRILLLLVNEVQAAGLTPAGLKQALTEEYSKHVRAPEVAVIVRSFSNRGVFVGGEVNSPGLIPLTEPLSVAGAVIKAGGLKETAQASQVVVLRKTDGEKQLTIEVNVDEILNRGRPDVPLEPADVIFVPKSTINVYVGGEVAQPGLVTFNGRLSLLSATVKAGGAKSTGRLDNVILLRDAGGGQPSLQRINLSAVLASKQADIPLKPFDVVFVPKTRIAKVNQFVDQYFRQLLPITFNAGFSYLLGASFRP